MEVEFNTGFVTALALFYGHRHQIQGTPLIRDLRIYGAADHLFDMEIPEQLDEKLKKRIERWRSKVISLRLKHLTWEEGNKLFDECLQILKALDRQYWSLKVIVKYK